MSCDVGPNITGQTDIPNGRATSGAAYYDMIGAFTYIDPTDYGNASGSGAGGRLDMSAGRVSAVYGRSSTVQPQAVLLLLCIKS